MRYVLAMLAAFALISSAEARTPMSMMEIIFKCSGLQCTIENNPGGSPVVFEAAAYETLRRNVKVRITGECASACVIFASKARRNVCVTETAKMMLHRGTARRAYVYAANIEATYFTPDYGSDITEWALSEGKMPYDTFYTMTRAEMLRFWKPCR